MSTHPLAWLIAALFLAAMVPVLVAMARMPGARERFWLPGLRALATLLLAGMLVQPQCQRQVAIEEKPVLAVLIDDSQSMNEGGGQSRAATVRQWLEGEACRKARDRCELRFFAFDAKLRELASPKDLTFRGSESKLGAALGEWNARWRDERCAGLLVLSDGLDTTGQDIAAPSGVAVSALALTSAADNQKERIQVWQVEPPANAQAGAESAARVILQAWGLGAREVAIEYWSEGRKLGERKVQAERDGEVVDIQLPLPPMPAGTYPFEVRVADPAATPASRVQPFVLVVRQEARHILFLQNALGFEGKFLRRALSSDRNVRLDSYTRYKEGGWAKLADTGETNAGATLELSTGGLGTRSVVILGDVAPSALTLAQWQALADFVDQGGGLVVLGGNGFLGAANPGSPLARVLPIPLPAPGRDGKFAARMTEAGARHPVFGPMFASVGGFPALQSANLADGVAPQAQVLMEAVADGQARPLVVAKTHGKGRCVVILTDTLWRWRVAASAWSGRQSPYDTFWGQLIGWLAPDAAGIQSQGRLELSCERGYYRLGDSVELRAEWIGRAAAGFSSVACTLRQPDGSTQPVVLHPASWAGDNGRRVQGFRANWASTQAGLHDVEASVQSDAGESRGRLRFAVANALGERCGEPAEHARLAALASASGGKYFKPDASGDWLASLPATTRTVTRTQATELWNHPLAGLLLLCTLCTEWYLRRRARLP